MNTVMDRAEQKELMRRWVETWRRAGPELEAIRRRELASMNTSEAIRQIFGDWDSFAQMPPSLSSGLVEQQAWFAKLLR